MKKKHDDHHDQFFLFLQFGWVSPVVFFTSSVYNFRDYLVIYRVHGTSCSIYPYVFVKQNLIIIITGRKKKSIIIFFYGQIILFFQTRLKIEQNFIPKAHFACLLKIIIIISTLILVI